MKCVFNSGLRLGFNNINLSYNSALSAKGRNYSTDSPAAPNPVKIYNNADIDKFLILKENKDKAGVYR